MDEGKKNSLGTSQAKTVNGKDQSFLNLRGTAEKVNGKGTLLSFAFRNNDVRMVTLDSAPWWVAKDVCLVLGYKNTNDAVAKHCRGVAKCYPIVDSLGRTQEARIINEPDLLRLITFCTLPAGVEFEKKVFEEILPQIRRYGYYVPKPAAEIPPEVLQSFMGEIFGEKRENKIARRASAATMKIIGNMGMGVDGFNRLCDYYNGTPLKYSDIAKLLDVSESTVGRWLVMAFDAGILKSRRERRSVEAFYG